MDPPTAPGADPLASAFGVQAASDFQIFHKYSFGNEIPAGYTGAVHEPTVANKGNTVLVAGNWFSAISQNGGSTFTFRNPSQGPFSGGGSFCCDQVAIYSPSRDAMFYLQQFSPDTGVQRINVDRGGDGSFECAYDFNYSSFALPAGTWLDFPDLVLGSNYLYHTTNLFQTPGNAFLGAVVARYSLDQIAKCGSLNYTYVRITDRGSFRATHGAGPVMYWATHNSNASIRIYRWAENGSNITAEDRALPNAWNPGDYSCPDSLGKDLCRRSDGRVQGAFLANGVLGFLWNSGRGGPFPYPQVQVARFRESDRALIGQAQIWHPGFAWAYPSVGVNARGHVAGTILTAGGSSAPMCAAWIADDFNGGLFAPLENWQVARSSTGPDQPVGGDYLTTRPHSPNANTWIGTCYSFQGGGGDFYARAQYVWFGRQRDNVVQTTCQPGATNLCLLGNRFKVKVDWRTATGTSGAGTAVPSTDNTGLFWFFQAANLELMIKVLDGRGVNGKYWVFYGALSDVEYWIEVTDTQTGIVRTYHNPQGNISGGSDTNAF